jgi:D-lyxose ketol-isomerase
MDISRREMIGGVIAGAAATSVVGAASAEEKKAIAMKKYKNEDFYKNGKFDAEAAKEAYYEMMWFYNYPVVPRLKTADFWALDFGLGNFLEAGMAGIFWVNNQKDGYFGHEIYLLPGQQIPEHKHVKTDAAGPKMEAWHVRHGWIYTFGEGTPTPGAEIDIPPMHRDIAHSRRRTKLMPGEVDSLAGPEQWHFMVAGPDGAIVSEYATYHDGTGLRFSHPKAAL